MRCSGREVLGMTIEPGDWLQSKDAGSVDARSPPLAFWNTGYLSHTEEQRLNSAMYLMG